MTEKILDLIEKKDFKQLKTILSKMLVPDIAASLEEIEDRVSIMIIFRLFRHTVIKSILFHNN